MAMATKLRDLLLREYPPIENVGIEWHSTMDNVEFFTGSSTAHYTIAERQPGGYMKFATFSERAFRNYIKRFETAGEGAGEGEEEENEGEEEEDEDEDEPRGGGDGEVESVHRWKGLHLHEALNGSCGLYADFDYKLDGCLTEEARVSTAERCMHLARRFIESSSHFRVFAYMDGSRKSKFSLHAVSKEAYFASNEDAGLYVRKMLMQWIKRKRVSRETKMLCDMVDMGVYNRRSNMRIAGTTKMGGGEDTLLRLPGHLSSVPLHEAIPLTMATVLDSEKGNLVAMGTASDERKAAYMSHYKAFMRRKGLMKTPRYYNFGRKDGKNSHGNGRGSGRRSNEDDPFVKVNSFLAGEKEAARKSIVAFLRARGLWHDKGQLFKVTSLFRNSGCLSFRIRSNYCFVMSKELGRYYAHSTPNGMSLTYYKRNKNPTVSMKCCFNQKCIDIVQNDRMNTFKIGATRAFESYCDGILLDKKEA